ERERERPGAARARGEDPEPEPRGGERAERGGEQQEIDRAALVAGQTNDAARRDRAEGQDQEHLPRGRELQASSCSGSSAGGRPGVRRLGSSVAATRKRSSGAVRSSTSVGGWLRSRASSRRPASIPRTAFSSARGTDSCSESDRPSATASAFATPS